MPNLSADQIERLQKTVHEGAMIRDWAQHPGFKLFKEWVENKILDKKNEWLRTTNDKDAEKIRQKASVWLDMLDEIKRFMLSGDNASRLLMENKKELEEETFLNQAPSIEGQALKQGDI